MVRTTAPDIQRSAQFDGGGVNTSQPGKILAQDKSQSHPYVVDSILTVYFESEKTRQDYLYMLFNHPVPRPGGIPLPEDDRCG